MMKTLIINGKVITPEVIVNNASVLCENGIIKDIIPVAKPEILADKIIDAQQNYISPGFIDMHVHGGGGADIMDGSVEAVIKVARTHKKYGMTSFVPTTLTSSVEKIKKAVLSVEEVMQSGCDGARVLGIHLEGPFLSMEYKGAQNPKYLIRPTIENYQNISGGSINVLRVSMAPEIEGAFELSEYLIDKGILLSVAHSKSDYQTMEKAAKHGFSHVTHMFNGMGGRESPEYYCRAGVVESALLLDDYKAEVICDGRHVPPEMIKLLYKCKGKDNMTLTTDAMRAADMPEGEYEIGGLSVLVTDGVAMLSDKTSFAGSVATVDRLVRNAVQNVGFDLVETINMVSLNVAKQIGWGNRIGSIEKGKWADIIIFNHNIDVIHVITK
jgi:N-acetylglucosamine-6-phosphate deacetylase